MINRFDEHFVLQFQISIGDNNITLNSNGQMKVVNIFLTSSFHPPLRIVRFFITRDFLLILRDFAKFIRLLKICKSEDQTTCVKFSHSFEKDSVVIFIQY